MLYRILPAVLLALMLVSPVAAEDADLEQGRTVAFTCLGCHGIPFHTNVYPTYFVPRIQGQTEGYIRAALHAYRDGSRRHPTMRAQSSTLSDEDIRDVAAYFASLGGSRR